MTSHTQDSYIGVNTLRVFEVQDRFANQMLQKGTTCVESNLAEITSHRYVFGNPYHLVLRVKIIP